jgi:hypothetical protein
MKPLGVRELLIAAALGLLVGLNAAFGWAKDTPGTLGLFVFYAVLIGAGTRRP